MLFSGLTLDVDVTSLIALALLIVPFVILNGLIFKPFLAVFEQRHDRIEGAVERAEAKLEEAEDKATEFEKQVEAAKRKGMDLRNTVRSAAQTAMNERLSQEQAVTDERVADAMAEIKRAEDSAMITVSAESHRLAEITASKLLGRSV